MTKGKDFYGSEIAEIIEQACRDLGRPREELDIKVLETGSAGIFGLCKKKAHIRVQVKKEASDSATLTQTTESAVPLAGEGSGKRQGASRSSRKTGSKKPAEKQQESKPVSPAPEEEGGPGSEELEAASVPTQECLLFIEERLSRILDLMGLASSVQVSFASSTILCSITGEHESYLASQDGKILDNLQYLLRKMLGPLLPDRVILSLDADGHLARRQVHLQEQAQELAALVRQSGKTKSLSGLNPAERQAVHQVLQRESEVRSRSVGSGLLKKVLIYKPNHESAGKGRGEAGAQHERD